MSEDFRVKSRFGDYEVRFCADFSAHLSEFVEKSFFLIDVRILELYGDKIEKYVPRDRMIVVEAVEPNKTMEFCQQTVVNLVEKGVKRGQMLLAIGGGIIQDITCFTASILYRGLDWAFFPTTLLAQADSCIGSKSSINLGRYKNLVGTFYPPRRIFIDPRFAATLSVEDIKSGIGEILHYYLIDNSEMIPDLVGRYESFLRDPSLLIAHISASLRTKKKMVEIDELDKDQRNVFNYGHTFGHAIESVSGYAVSHGQAVTLGMDLANFVSMRLGLIDEKTYRVMREILVKNIPDYRLDESALDVYLAALSKDKKNTDGGLTCILTEGLGRMSKKKIPLDGHLRTIVKDYFVSK